MERRSVQFDSECSKLISWRLSSRRSFFCRNHSTAATLAAKYTDSIYTIISSNVIIPHLDWHLRLQQNSAVLRVAF